MYILILIGFIGGCNGEFSVTQDFNGLMSYLNSTLETLDFIKFSFVKEQDVKMLAPEFSHPKVKDVVAVRFVGNSIGDEGAKELAPMLDTLTKLKALDFQRSGIGKK